MVPKYSNVAELRYELAISGVAALEDKEVGMKILLKTTLGRHRKVTKTRLSKKAVHEFNLRRASRVVRLRAGRGARGTNKY
jgi:hypothetical protein